MHKVDPAITTIALAGLVAIAAGVGAEFLAAASASSAAVSAGVNLTVLLAAIVESVRTNCSSER